jgi:hypothetical protein
LDALLISLKAAKVLHVIGGSELGTLPDPTAQADAEDCGDDPGCLASVGRSLQVDYLGIEGVTNADEGYAVTLRVIDVKAATVLMETRQQVSSDAALDPASDQIADEVVKKVIPPQQPTNLTPPPPTALPPPAVTAPQPEPGSTPYRMSTGRVAGIAALVVGGLSLVTATVIGVTARNDAGALMNKKPSTGIASEVSSINSRAISADVLWGIGGAAAGVGVGLTVAFP